MNTSELTAMDQKFHRGPTRGWCPGVLDPMETGDGWLLRVRVPGGLVTSSTLASVAAVAREFGSGMVDITSRANIQIRGVQSDALDRAISAAVDAGLVGENAQLDALRAVVSSPLSGHDRISVCDARPVVTAIVKRLKDRIVGTVPSKFGIVVDDGGAWPTRHIDADISLRANRDGSWAVRVRGDGEPIGSTLDPVGVAELATKWCVDEAARMDRLVAAVGRSIATERLALTLPSLVESPQQTASERYRILGLVEHHNIEAANVVAAPFLGRVDSETLLAIAVLGVAHGADMRLTPDHSFALCGVAATSAAELIVGLSKVGLVVDRFDPRAAISACVGSGGCIWGNVDTVRVANERAANGCTPERVHLSACAKQCGAPPGVRQLVADTNGTFR